jgi:hypothetical protein
MLPSPRTAQADRVASRDRRAMCMTATSSLEEREPRMLTSQILQAPETIQKAMWLVFVADEHRL